MSACCNLVEQPDGTAIQCQGTMTPHWPVFVCDTCDAKCGAQAHPLHSPAPVRRPDTEAAEGEK